jgi:hypothetical protein
MIEIATLQLVTGATLIGFGIVRRRSFGWGLVILGAMNTSSAVWVLAPNVGVGSRLALVGIFLIATMTAGRRELCRQMRAELVLTAMGILAIAVSQLLIPAGSRFQAEAITVLVASYIGLLTMCCVRTIPRLFHPARSR